MLSVAVIIPAYNAERYIEDALDSVAAQTRAPAEIIVVNDGSTDGTSHRVRAWSERTSVSVKLIDQSNAGISAARNAAIAAANSDLIALLDSDDMFLPDHLESVAGAIDRNPSVVLCFGDGELLGPQGTLRRSLVYDSQIETLEYDELENGLRLFRGSVYTSLLPGNYIPTSGTVLRREFAIAAGLYDTTLHVTEDRDFMMRMSRTGRFAFIPKTVHIKRKHDSNVTHARNTPRNMQDQFRVLKKMLAISGELGLSAEEIRRTRAELSRQSSSLLYEASRRGVTAYAGVVAFMVGRGVVRPVFRAKHLVRAVAFSTPLRGSVAVGPDNGV